jgi:hypothetical protein
MPHAKDAEGAKGILEFGAFLQEGTEIAEREGEARSGGPANHANGREGVSTAGHVEAGKALPHHIADNGLGFLWTGKSSRALGQM